MAMIGCCFDLHSRAGDCLKLRRLSLHEWRDAGRIQGACKGAADPLDCAPPKKGIEVPGVAAAAMHSIPADLQKLRAV